MKNNKKPKIKVTPINVVTGAKAPYYIIDGDNKNTNDVKSALDEAKSRSALSTSPRFTFRTEKC